MSTEQPIRDEVPTELIQGAGSAPVPEAEPAESSPPPVARGWAWIRSRTGKRPLSDYREHPLRPVAADGWARILRGFEGILGELDFALVDIAMGLIGVMWDLVKKQKEAAADGKPADGAGAVPRTGSVDPRL